MKSLYPEYEIKLLNSGFDAVIGIDEAGRGPWAGPVSIAAYIFTKDMEILDGINDSKKISKEKRTNAFSQIQKQHYLHELISSQEIDKVGIGKVIESSIQNLINQTLLQLNNKNIIFLIDGYFKKVFDAEYELIKGGDARHYSIGAASIIAKYKRDQKMYEFAEQYPVYGFDKHVGYGTKKHRIALEKYGPCPIHRFSYKPISSFL